jgi:predicted kinase
MRQQQMSALNAESAWSFPYCPASPNWQVDWAAVQQQFPWIRAMQGVMQDPLYHAEGDVLIHTRMVAEALAALDEWRALPEAERSVLFASALLHDVAKPACTAVESDGRITSKGHARKGELLAREILWTGDDVLSPPPLLARETIAKLVRFHGLPLWFLEKASPERAVIEASQMVRLNRLALLAEVDVRGRECPDQAELLGRIDLFRDFCQEQRCYTAPRAFASAHSRFEYFRSEARDPDYEAYDDTKFEVILMAGLPGVGKDTWVRQHLAGWPVISLDHLRQELDVTPREGQGPVVQAARTQAREFLRAQQPFVWNATNITRLLRRQLIDFFASYHARVHLIYLDAPLDVILSRNAARPNRVPEHVIRQMLRKLEVPNLTEAHTVEWVSTGKE